MYSSTGRRSSPRAQLFVRIAQHRDVRSVAVTRGGVETKRDDKIPDGARPISTALVARRDRDTACSFQDDMYISQ
jgi:hypothetical protein